MLANGAHFGSLLTNVDVTAVGADPNLNFFGNEDGFGVELFENCSVSFFVFLFDLAYCFEEVCDSVKAFFLSGFCKTCEQVQQWTCTGHSPCLNLHHEVSQCAAVLCRSIVGPMDCTGHSPCLNLRHEVSQCSALCKFA